MKLNEAKQILKQNGFILEDTEDDELFDVDLEMKDELAKGKNYNWKKVDKLSDKYTKLKYKRDDVDTKFEQAKMFNLKKALDDAGIDYDYEFDKTIWRPTIEISINKNNRIFIYADYDIKTGKGGYYCYNSDFDKILYSADDVVKFLNKFIK